MRYKPESALEFSLFPIQCDLLIETPKGIGSYEGTTGSGIIKVFIEGGVSEFSWHECLVLVRDQHIDVISGMSDKLKKHQFYAKQIESIAFKCQSENSIDPIVNEALNNCRSLKLQNGLLTVNGLCERCGEKLEIGLFCPKCD